MKICVLAAGAGTRNPFAKALPKGLLPVDNLPILGRLLDLCPPELEILCALGHLGDLYRQYFSHAYPDRKVTFVQVPVWQGAGSGPGRSLWECRTHLQEPFILLPTDAFLDEKLPHKKGDWLGVTPVEESAPYCLAQVDSDGKVTDLHDKVPNAPEELLSHAFTGIAQIASWEAFFQGLEKGSHSHGEWQVADGFRALFKTGLDTVPLKSWQDVGTAEGYKEVLSHFSSQQLVKTEEITFLQGERVIKFHTNPSLLSKKVERGRSFKGWVPPIELATPNFFSYRYIPGRLLSDAEEDPIFSNFLSACENSFFQRVALPAEGQKRFEQSCFQFYRDKTQDRLSKFLERFPEAERITTIDGEKVPSIGEFLKMIPWESLSKGIPCRFHGDLQPENILYLKDGSFVFLDWRHEFTADSPEGDLYYELAKIQHALWVSGKIIRNGGFSVLTAEEGSVTLELDQRPNLLRFATLLQNYTLSRGLSLAKVNLLTALVYLNIACLYERSYALFLYCLGKKLLNDAIRNSTNHCLDPALPRRKTEDPRFPSGREDLSLRRVDSQLL